MMETSTLETGHVAACFRRSLTAGVIECRNKKCCSGCGKKNPVIIIIVGIIFPRHAACGRNAEQHHEHRCHYHHDHRIHFVDVGRRSISLAQPAEGAGHIHSLAL